MSSYQFRKRLLASSIAVVLGTSLSASVLAAEEANKTEENEETENVILITGIRGSLKTSINNKRASNVVMDSVTLEDIGKLPDANIADTLSRIPGIAVSKQFGEGATVSIRGASNQFTLTNLNGQNIASTGWYSQQAIDRSFNFSLLPSELIAGIDVYKSSQANIVEGGVGGTVEVKTHKPLNLKANTVFGSVKAQYSDGSGETDPQISGLYSWKNDEETFGFLFAAASQEYNLERKGTEALISWGGRVADVNFQQARERSAYDLTLQFAPNDRFDMALHYLDLELGADSVNTANWVPQIGGRADTDGCQATIPGNDGAPVCVLRTTTAADGQQPFWDVRPRNATMTSETIDFKATYAGDTYELSGQIGKTEAKGGTNFETNYGILSIDPQFAAGTIDARGDRVIMDVPGYGPSDLPGAGDYATWEGLQTSQVVSQPNLDEEQYMQVDLDLDVDFGAINKLEFGIRSTEHDVEIRTFRGQFANGVTFPDASTWASGTLEAGYDGRYIPAPNVAAMLAHTRANMTSLDEDLSGFATVNEENFSAYAMASFEGDYWRGNFGFRFIDTEISSEYYGQTFTGGNVVFSSSTQTDKASYDDVLPSMNLVYQLSDDSNLRFTAATVVSRPNYDDLFANLEVSGRPDDNVPGNEALNKGNVSLLPYSADQYDISYEYYFDDSSLLGVTLFHKEVSDFVRPVVELNQSIGIVAPDLVGLTAAELAALGCSSTDCWDIERYGNGKGGSISGVELQLIHDFGNGWGTVINYTYSDAETDPGNYADRNPAFSDSSENYVNLVAFYEGENFSARAAYNWRSEFMVRETGFYANRLHDSIGTLDLNFDYQINDNLKAVFAVVNATGEDDIETGNDNPALNGNSGAPRFTNGYPVSSYQRDTLISLGINYSF
ncbi:TonB-dependent receptor [Aliikangiella coralliicola]|uniref:TonB-dependent receptor n=1 Tax=Aliikangiella coralliicola TaxID=2592383 RepID=A0A545UHI2_9GAMM|nr:TonB-dependent receptor [Aliikangiella coralliicola]TQV88922.1 TonB-dependent receptor [Aliikangiella coralliicola]